MQAVYAALLAMFVVVALHSQSSGQQPPENAPVSLHREARQQSHTNPSAEPIPAALSWKGTLPNGAHSFTLSGTERWAPPFKLEKRGRVHRHADIEDAELFRFQSGYVPAFGQYEAVSKLEDSFNPRQLSYAGETICVFTSKPVLSGCESLPDSDSQENCTRMKVLEFVFKNFRYPPQLKDFCFSGPIVLGCVIEKNGQVGEVKVVRSIHPLFDEEAVRVVKSMPAWIPAERNGQAVAAHYIFPLRFCL